MAITRRKKLLLQPKDSIEEPKTSSREGRPKSVKKSEGSSPSPKRPKTDEVDSECISQEMVSTRSSKKRLLQSKDSIEEPKTSSREGRPKSAKKKSEGSSPSPKRPKKDEVDSECVLAGEPVVAELALQRWPKRYASKEPDQNDDNENVLYARCHYEQALVDGVIYNLLDDAIIKGEDGEPDYIGRIVELFQSIDNKPYFTAQWFFKAEDTVIKGRAELIDDRRVFYSDLRDDNSLDCILSKIKVVQVPLKIDLSAVPTCDFYYNLKYSIDYSTFSKLDTGNEKNVFEASSTVLGEVNTGEQSDNASMPQKLEMTLLDLYSGCGGMSTGLCLGASISGVNLVTRWAVDMNEHACKSLKLNHPKTEVRNESADDFLELLKKWQELCEKFCSKPENLNLASEKGDDEADDTDDQSTFEVEEFVGICFGDPYEKNKPELHFKVRWKGYGSKDDTWEPIDGLGNCEERIKNFVISGCKSKILPLPGDVDVICGGPPCQGISGFNRFRNDKDPLADPLNHQLDVYMDIVKYLKPRFVLMENVVDLLKFAGGYLGRHALGRLVSMDYQTRLGLMVAGCYGLPQFRSRVFVWGACPSEKLPQFPLPTHEVVVRGIFPNEFERNVVAYCEEDEDFVLERPLLLEDAISDLPPVMNNETRDVMGYDKDAETEFQRYIRLSKGGMLGINTIASNGGQNSLLYDHRPLNLNVDDYERVCQIPKRKGANFRDLRGVVVGTDRKVGLDTSIERVYLPSGKPLVPDYALKFVKGRSLKPFARLWWDETVSTVVTRAEPHNQKIIHPEQDRVLSIRENARLQGFPDYYKFCGPVKKRYIQVGNAVAVPVGRALGYALGMTSQGKCDDFPMFMLPLNFPNCSASIEAAE